MKTTRVTELGMLLAISLVLAYMETLLPVMIAIPGVKLGLANIVTMLVLYRRNWKSAFFFMMLRVVLAGFLFSGVAGILYSFVGGLFCICVMNICKRFPFFSTLGVSMAGAVFHNAGQIVVAFFVMENGHIFYYLPVLCISGIASGLIVGYLTHLILENYNKNISKD